MTVSAKRHLHPALVHMLLAGFSAICFAVAAFNVAHSKPITTFDAQFAPRIYNYAVTHPHVLNFAENVTELGSRWPRTGVVIGVALILLLHRQWRLTLFWAATQWALPELNNIAKEWFERPRPGLGSAGGWSFPSGHAMGAMTTYGMIAFLVAWRWPGRWFAWLAIVGLAAIILMVGLSRMLLGVHWFTDILGGYLHGLTWISLCVAVIEWQRVKQVQCEQVSTASTQ